jgi:hypothetical protein
MKKLLILLFIFSIVSINHAQEFRGMGLKVGATLTSQEWDYSLGSIDPDNRMGFNIGVFAEFFDLQFFSVVGEVNYVQKGLTNLEGIVAETLLGGDVRLNYLNLAALAKLRFNYVVFSPYIVAGPKIDIELNREAAIENLVVSNFSKERVGFKLGIGTELDLKSVILLAEFLYDADFNELYNENNLVIDSKSYDFRIGILF